MVVLFENNPPEGYVPLEGAKVSIGTISDITDETGFFELLEVPVGERTLVVKHEDYISIQQQVVVTEDAAQSSSVSNFRILNNPVLLALKTNTSDLSEVDFHFEALADDPNGQPFTPSIVWSVTGDGADIDPASGIFSAKKSGIFSVTAVINSTASSADGSISDTVNIKVEDEVVTITGSVTHENGTPVPNAQVYVEDNNLFVLTDSSGHYVLPGVPASTILTVIGSVSGGIAEGSTVVTVDNPNQSVEANIVIYTVLPGSTPAPAAGTGNVEGKVFESYDSVPIGNAYIVFYTLGVNSSSITEQNFPDKITSSNSTGDFTLADVPEGDCRLEFWRSESDYKAEPSNPLGFAGGTVVKDDTVTINITASPGTGDWQIEIE